MKSIRQLKYFVEIVESGSFNKAEESQYISRQALMKQINTLELELGFELLVRKSSGVSLTHAGKKFYSDIKPILTDLETLCAQCQKLAGSDSVIKIGTPAHPRLILEKVFQEFTRQYPDIKIEIMFLETSSKLNFNYIHDGTIDISETVLTPGTKLDGLGHTKLADLHYHCLFRDDHPLARENKISLPDLAGRTVHIRRDGNVEFIQKLKEDFPEINIVEVDTHDDISAIHTICNNKGIYIARAYFIPFLQPYTVIPLICDYEMVSTIVYRKSHSATVSKFIEVCKNLFPL